MKLISLLTTTPMGEIVRAHNEHYDETLTYDQYDRFIKNIKRHVMVESSLKIVIDHIVMFHPEEYSDLELDEDYYSVSILDSDGEKWAMDFMAWNRLLPLEVESRSDIPLSNAEMAAHAYWEITWHGDEEDAMERREEINDIMEDLNEDKISKSSIYHLFDQLPYGEIERIERASREATQYINGKVI